MKVGLFIPCYINHFYPQVGIATIKLLEKLNVHVHYPKSQTCCGQPMANSGFERYSKESYKLFVKNFQDYDYIVSPSGSCVYHVRKHYDIIEANDKVNKIRKNTFELCDFIVNVLGDPFFEPTFNKRVGLHQSCHGLRGLRLGQSTEMTNAPFSISKFMLQKVKGLELVGLNREDECCGFGGTFSVFEECISVKMGNDRILDHTKNNVEVITSTDMSCLMHLEGLLKRRNSSIEVKHIAEILNSKW